jgi:PAS domain S-box-containing protein
MIHAEDGQVITINTPWTQLTAYEHSDIPTIADWTRKAYGTQMDLVREEIDHLYSLDGPKAEGEYTINTSFGEQRIWDFSSAPIGQLPDGRRLVISMAMDVTERKKVEAERTKFFLLAESSSEFIGMCDLDMNPLYVNPAGQRLVGLPDMAAACQVKVQDYFFPEDQRFIAEEFFPRVLREGHGDVEIRLRHFLSGEPIWMYYYLFSVRDARGTVVGWATVSHDITERRLAEEKAHRLYVELEKRVAERTAELRGLVNSMAGREVRMAELKDVIRQLRDQLEQSGQMPVADDPLAGL